MTEASCPTNFFPISKSLAGMARPGFGHSHSASRMEALSKGTLEEIEQTLLYCHEKGYTCLISLGSSLYTRHDAEIRSQWEALGGQFHAIINEDHAIGKRFKTGSGPTADKISNFIALSTGKKTVIYCGEGTGRTGTYAIAHLLHENRRHTVDDAYQLINTAMFKKRAPIRPSQLHDEITENGGLAALHLYAETLLATESSLKKGKGQRRRA